MIRKLYIFVLLGVGLFQFAIVANDYFNFATSVTVDIKPKTGLIDMPAMTFCVSKEYFNSTCNQNCLMEHYHDKHFPIRSANVYYKNFNERKSGTMYMTRTPTVISYFKNEICSTYMSSLYGDLVNHSFAENYKIDARHGPLIETRLILKSTIVKVGIHSPNTPPHSLFEAFISANESYLTTVLNPITEHLLPPPYRSDCFDYGNQKQESFLSRISEITTFLSRKPKSYQDCLILCLQSETECVDKSLFYTADLLLNVSYCKHRRNHLRIYSKICRERCRPDCKTEHYFVRAHFQPVMDTTCVFIRRNRDEIDYNYQPKIIVMDLFEQVGGLMSFWFNVSVLCVLLCFLKSLKRRIGLNYLKIFRFVFWVFCFTMFAKDSFNLSKRYFLFGTQSEIKLLPSIKAVCRQSTSVSENINSFRNTRSETKEQSRCASGTTTGTSNTAWRSSSSITRT